MEETAVNPEPCDHPKQHWGFSLKDGDTECRLCMGKLPNDPEHINQAWENQRLDLQPKGILLN